MRLDDIARPMADRVLVAFDGSDPSRAAVRHAASIFPSATFEILYVSDPVEWAGTDDMGGYFSDRAFADMEETARTVVAEGRDLVPDEQSVRTHVRVGRPARTIVEAAADLDVDHVVVGTHGRRGMSRLILGSVAELVARRSPVAVTVVGPPDAE